MAWVICPNTAIAQVVMLNGMAEQVGWFESWAFQGQTESAVKKRFASQTEVELRQYHLACKLSDEQMAKLRLAAKGDVSRFFRDVEKARRATEGMQPDQANIDKIQQHLQPVQLKMSQGLFDEKSLFRQVLGATLSPEQKAELERVNAVRDERTLQAAIRVSISRMQSKVPMTEVQREAFRKLMTEEVLTLKIPRKLQMQAVDYFCWTIDESKIASIFDEQQIAVFKKQAAVAANMKPYLVQQGIKLP